MNRRVITLIIALVLILGGGSMLYGVLTESGGPPGMPETAGDGEREKAPDFMVEDANGNKARLSDMRGSPVVVNFWASWCPPCRSEMPAFNKVFLESGETVQFMMINAVGARGETKEAGAKYIAEEGFSFPVYYDVEQDAMAEYGIRSLPTSIFVDAEGYIAGVVEGSIDEATLKRGIELIIE